MVVREFNLGLSDFDLNYLRWFTKYCLLLVFNTWTKGGGDFCSGCFSLPSCFHVIPLAAL